MMNDQPSRWDRDSEAEDYEAERARRHDALSRREWERGAERLAERLGLPPPVRGTGESWTGPVLPPWWFLVTVPRPRCALCQRRLDPGEEQRMHPWPGETWCCKDCYHAQQADPAPGSLVRHWVSLPAQRRRLNLACVFGLDPWTGKRVLEVVDLR